MEEGVGGRRIKRKIASREVGAGIDEGTKEVIAQTNEASQLIDNVKFLIEQCIKLYMNKQEILDRLWRNNSIERGITECVWEKLVQENSEFFNQYYAVMRHRSHIVNFNCLLRKQGMLMPTRSQYGVSPVPLCKYPRLSSNTLQTQSANTIRHGSNYSGARSNMLRTQVGHDPYASAARMLTTPALGEVIRRTANQSGGIPLPHTTQLGSPKANYVPHTENPLNQILHGGISRNEIIQQAGANYSTLTRRMGDLTSMVASGNYSNSRLLHEQQLGRRIMTAPFYSNNLEFPIGEEASVPTGWIENSTTSEFPIGEASVPTGWIENSTTSEFPIGEASVPTGWIENSTTSEFPIGEASVPTGWIENSTTSEFPIGEASVPTGWIENSTTSEFPIGEASVPTGWIENSTTMLKPGNSSTGGIIHQLVGRENMSFPPFSNNSEFLVGEASIPTGRIKNSTTMLKSGDSSTSGMLHEVVGIEIMLGDGLKENPNNILTSDNSNTELLREPTGRENVSCRTFEQFRY